MTLADGRKPGLPGREALPPLKKLQEDLSILHRLKRLYRPIGSQPANLGTQ